jgi:hypothetical protein
VRVFRLAETTPRYNRYKIISNNEEPASYQKKGASSRLTPHNDPMERHAWNVRHLLADHDSRFPIQTSYTYGFRLIAFGL